MDEQQYLVKRVDDQISWYSKESKKSQSYYKIINITVMIATLLISAGAGFNYFNEPLIPVILGLIASSLEFTLKMNKYQEKWILYRSTCEELKREKYMYLTKSGIYAIDENSFNKFVERVETITAVEQALWRTKEKDINTNKK